MSFVAGRPWDMFAAELSDTQRGQHQSRPLLPCVYCSKPTRSVYRVCCAHDDLIDLDPGAPSALEETRAAQSPDGAELAAELASSSTAFVSSSADSPDGTIGDGLSGAAALDSLETT